MNRGAQTWDCGELGREGKRKEGLKGNKEGKQYMAHRYSHRGAEKNGNLFLSLNCQVQQWCSLLAAEKHIAVKPLAQEHSGYRRVAGVSLSSYGFEYSKHLSYRHILPINFAVLETRDVGTKR